jgi:dephospho-CoA kinase
LLKVGLTGGYATGKSFVAAELKRLGCNVIAADKLGHEVLGPNGAAYLPTVETFGPEILNPDATIDRKRLGQLVFASKPLLEKLNSIVHPAVYQLEDKLLREFAENNPTGIAVVEAAILIETGRYREYSVLILTTCSEETQIARGIERDHLTREQVIDRLHNQLPLNEKKKFAQYIIDTDRPKAETSKQVEEVFAELTERRTATASS